MTAGSGSEAVANGREYTRYEVGYCQKYVRGPCWEVGSLYGSAIEAWNGAREKHPGDRTPPVGAPVYYSGGSYGHVALYVGNGRIRSTDCPENGQVGETDLDWPTRRWGHTYLGWTGDINAVHLPLTDAPDPPAGDDTEEDDDMPFLFRTNADADGADGKGAAYLVFGTQAVQMATGWTYDGELLTIRSSTEEMDQAFYAAVTRHRL